MYTLDYESIDDAVEELLQHYIIRRSTKLRFYVGNFTLQKIPLSKMEILNIAIKCKILKISFDNTYEINPSIYFHNTDLTAERYPLGFTHLQFKDNEKGQYFVTKFIAKNNRYHPYQRSAKRNYTNTEVDESEIIDLNQSEPGVILYNGSFYVKQTNYEETNNKNCLIPYPENTKEDKDIEHTLEKTSHAEAETSTSNIMTSDSDSSQELFGIKNEIKVITPIEIKNENSNNEFETRFSNSVCCKLAKCIYEI